MQTSKITALAVGGPTLLLEYGGVRLLTDPAFDPPGEYPRAPHPSLHKTAGPALSPEEIGEIDVVLLSHDHHADNLDGAGRRFLPRAGRVITTTLGAERLGGNATGLDPWQSIRLDGPAGGSLIVTAVPAQHGPDGTDHLTGPVIGFALHGDGLPSLYVSGDNASVAVVEAIEERLGRFDVAVLFAGGAWVSPINDHITLTAKGAADAARILGARVVIPNHFDGWSHFTEGFEDLKAAFGGAGLADRLLPALPGARVHVELDLQETRR
jgi:L-ascorbate metabolism protein UlaG (beta-lactamase superfamily)